MTITRGLIRLAGLLSVEVAQEPGLQDRGIPPNGALGLAAPRVAAVNTSDSNAVQRVVITE
jgi:hypothetical protein